MLTFEEINNFDKIPKQREGKYPRSFMQKLVRTWLCEGTKDKMWFDQRNIFNNVKFALIEKLKSHYVDNSKIRK